MSEKNLALLTQDEIDTLISIINEKRIRVGAQVLSQDKIDALIEQLLKTAINGEPTENGPCSLDTAKAIQGKKLEISYNEDNSYIEVYVDGDDGSKIYITPKCLETESIIDDKSRWGRGIEPYLFDKIARIFELTYTRDVYNSICSCFSEIMYGSKDAVIDDIYLPACTDLMLD